MKEPRLHRICLWVEIAGLAVFAVGCQGAYYRTMETLGKHKRDLLVDRVGDARDAQQGAKEQFQTALEKFSSVVKVPTGELQSKYNQQPAERLRRSPSRRDDRK